MRDFIKIGTAIIKVLNNNENVPSIAIQTSAKKYIHSHFFFSFLSEHLILRGCMIRKIIISFITNFLPDLHSLTFTEWMVGITADYSKTKYKHYSVTILIPALSMFVSGRHHTLHSLGPRPSLFSYRSRLPFVLLKFFFTYLLRFSIGITNLSLPLLYLLYLQTQSLTH